MKRKYYFEDESAAKNFTQYLEALGYKVKLKYIKKENLYRIIVK